MHKNNKKKNGFTLVELLAVIVVLAVILLIAAPKIQTVIESSRKSSIEATTMVIADNAEMIYANKKLLDKNYNPNVTPIQCDEVAKLSSDDYGTCKITFNNEGEASVVLRGKGSFEEYACTGTSSSSKCNKVTHATTFANDSWGTIKSVIDIAKEYSLDDPELDDELKKYKVGSTKEVTINGKEYTVRIANNSHYDCGLESETACGFVVEFVDIVDKKQMNSTDTNAGGWRDSAMRAYLNGEFYNLLPEELKGSIKTVKVVSGHGSISDETNFVTDDAVYLLSTAEIWYGGVSYDAAIDSNITRQLDYYNSESINGIEGATQITTSNYASTLVNTPVKYLYWMGSVEPFSWWLRSANTTDRFCRVQSGGGIVSNAATYPYGVAPAFRLG